MKWNTQDLPWNKLRDWGGASSLSHQAPKLKLSLITSTGLNLINCKNIHYSPSSALLLCVHTQYNLFAHSSCTCLFILIFINPQYTVLHILSHCTFYSLFYFIICSYFYFILTYIYIYSLVLCFIFLHCPLSGPVLTYISLLIIPCMIVYVTNNKEPWTLNLEPRLEESIFCSKTFIYLSGFIVPYKTFKLPKTYALTHPIPSEMLAFELNADNMLEGLAPL